MWLTIVILAVLSPSIVLLGRDVWRNRQTILLRMPSMPPSGKTRQTCMHAA